MSEENKECYACRPGPKVIRDMLGECDGCWNMVSSIDHLHEVGGQDLCEKCARAAGHFDEKK